MIIMPVDQISHNKSRYNPQFKCGFKIQSYSEFMAEGADEFIRGTQKACDSKIKEEIQGLKELYEEFIEENNRIFMEHILPKSREIAQKILELPGYNKSGILPFLADRKPSELRYLYRLALKTDLSGELRIPGVTFPYFSEIPIPKLKILEPIILSKNDFNLWNYSPSYILNLDKYYNEEQLYIMSRLAGTKVNGRNLRYIAENPYLNHQKTIEKAQGLNNLYGENLREINFFSNRFHENFLSADIQLPHRDDKPDALNFERVYARLDSDVNPVLNLNSKTKIDKYINQMYSSLEKRLAVFTQDDLEHVIYNTLREIPDTDEYEVLTTIQRITQFSNYSSFSKLSNELKEAKIDQMYPEGGINPLLYYLHKKKSLFEFSDDMFSISKAIFVTKEDLDNREFLSLMKKAKNGKNIVFINLEGWSDGINLFTDDRLLEEKTKIVLKKAKKIQKKNPDFTFDDALDYVLNRSIESRIKNMGFDCRTIKLEAPATRGVVLDQMRPIMPTQSLLKSTVESIAKHHAKTKKEFRELCMEIAKYYDKNLNVYSKQSIIENLELINNKINYYLTRHNIPQENLYILLPNTPSDKKKSFDIISKMYIEKFSIPDKNIIRENYVTDLNKYPPNSAFVILDDLVGSGASMVEFGEYMYRAGSLAKDKHILFCPITTNQKGLEYINFLIRISSRTENDIVLNIEKNTQDYSDTVSEFLQGRNSEVYKQVFGKKGHDLGGMCTIFPYMTPDNNSTLANYLAKFFLPNDKCITNRNKLIPVIEEETYYYDIFGTDKSHILKDDSKVFKKTKLEQIYMSIMNFLNRNNL